MSILGIILMTVLVIGGLVKTGQVSAFVDIPSLILTVGGTLGALLMSYGMGIGKACKAFFDAAADDETLRTGLKVVEQGQSYAIMAGLIGTVIGLVSMLANVDDPKHIGPGMATAFITLVYAILIAYGFLLPVASLLRSKLSG